MTETRIAPSHHRAGKWPRRLDRKPVNGRAGGLPPLHVKVEAVIGAGTEAPATNIASEICTLPPNGCVLVFLTDKANVHDEPGLH